MVCSRRAQKLTDLRWLGYRGHVLRFDWNQKPDEIGGDVVALAARGSRISQNSTADRSHAVSQLKRAARLDATKDVEKHRARESPDVDAGDVREDVQFEAALHRIYRFRADRLTPSGFALSMRLNRSLNDLGRHIRGVGSSKARTPQRCQQFESDCFEGVGVGMFFGASPDGGVNSLAKVAASLVALVTGFLQGHFRVCAESQRLLSPGRPLKRQSRPPDGVIRRKSPFSSKSFRDFSEGFAARIAMSVSIWGYASVVGPRAPGPYPTVPQLSVDNRSAL